MCIETLGLNFHEKKMVPPTFDNNFLDIVTPRYDELNALVDTIMSLFTVFDIK
jgi:hypothetical protein